MTELYLGVMDELEAMTPGAPIFFVEGGGQVRLSARGRDETLGRLCGVDELLLWGLSRGQASPPPAVVRPARPWLPGGTSAGAAAHSSVQQAPLQTSAPPSARPLHTNPPSKLHYREVGKG
jgi:hypothetical protein